MEKIEKRNRPILGYSCPICNSVFAVTALHTDFIDGTDVEENERMIKELTEYAMQGLDVRIYNNPSDYNFHYCEHVKNREK
jgi:hypothetical protein